jgi:hypothetical protein
VLLLFGASKKEESQKNQENHKQITFSWPHQGPHNLLTTARPPPRCAPPLVPTHPRPHHLPWPPDVCHGHPQAHQPTHPHLPIHLNSPDRVLFVRPSLLQLSTLSLARTPLCSRTTHPHLASASERPSHARGRHPHRVSLSPPSHRPRARPTTISSLALSARHALRFAERARLRHAQPFGVTPPLPFDHSTMCGEVVVG